MTVTAGDRLPTLSTRITRTDLVRYAGASGDFNPIHHSDFFAAQVRLPGVIAHGMLTMATALRVVTDWTGDPQAVRSYTARFTKPVVVPDDGIGAELVVEATVTDVSSDGSVAVVSIEATCAGEKVLGAARAEVDLGRFSPAPAA